MHEYVYYRCTRKSKMVRCTQKPITEPELLAQLVDIVQGYALPADCAAELLRMLDEDEQRAEQSSGAFIAEARGKVYRLQMKLQRLLDSYLDQDIDQATYKAKQAELMSEKKTIGEQIGKLTLAANAWVEPMRQWLKQASDLQKITKNAEPSAVKSAFAQIDGLNLYLENKKVRLSPRPISELPPANLWGWLRQSLEKIAHSGENFSESPILVRLYNEVRTHFEQNV